MLVPLEQLERAIFGMNQIEVVRRDWPMYRYELVKIRDKYAASTAHPGHAHVAEFAQIALAKHDERYAETTDAENDAILAPLVGTGLIGSTRRSIIVHTPPDPASLV